jgi:hypothetical protein
VKRKSRSSRPKLTAVQTFKVQTRDRNSRRCNGNVHPLALKRLEMANDRMLLIFANRRTGLEIADVVIGEGPVK